MRLWIPTIDFGLFESHIYTMNLDAHGTVVSGDVRCIVRFWSAVLEAATVTQPI
ncbi:hypothetical protein Syun_007903 [Stephania yunnanensis]|uniref:Uncharacterized protein n=1 Tax=Stephania yunnanensis TaxID=152371 RepID=A0AAP0KZ98_9MAGN